MATLNSYKILNNSLSLNFSSFLFTKTVTLDLIKDIDTINKIKNILNQKLLNSKNLKLEFKYDGHDITVERTMVLEILNKLN